MSKNPESLTIGRLAKAAGVNIETIRYYQERKLVTVPAMQGKFRYYPADTIDRIQFIKRSQQLGFSLAEIADLLKLNEKTDRKTIRRIANDKLHQIQAKLEDLLRMQQTLQDLINACEHSPRAPCCPIIASLSNTAD